MGDMKSQIFQRAQSGKVERRDHCLIYFLNDNNLLSASTFDIHIGANPTFVSL